MHMSKRDETVDIDEDPAADHIDGEEHIVEDDPADHEAPEDAEDAEDEHDDLDLAVIGSDDQLDDVEAVDLDTLPAALGVPAIRFVAKKALHIEHGLWRNPRKFTGLDEESLSELAASISLQTKSSEEATIAGIEDPLKVVMIQTQVGIINLVIDGQRRFMAIERTYGKDGEVLVPVIDLEPEPIDALTKERVREYTKLALLTVGTRKGLSSPELVESAVSLREAGDTLSVIAKIIGRSESWVSKMLKAMDTASPQLALKWRTGHVTDEQFKDLASQKDPVKQKAAVAAVVQARESGDKSASRVIAKEQKELQKAAEVKPKSTAPAGAKVREARKNNKREPEQTSMPTAPPRKPPSMAVVEDVLSMAVQHPPTSDYVKGIMDGIKWDRGMFDAADFGKAWHAYLIHVKGGGKVAPASAAKPKPPKNAKMKKGGKRK
jgi:hypothetical protein